MAACTGLVWCMVLVLAVVVIAEPEAEPGHDYHILHVPVKLHTVHHHKIKRLPVHHHHYHQDLHHEDHYHNYY